MTCFLLAAVTIDGFIARSANDRSFDWTSEEDKRFYVESIKRAKAMVMGNTTFQTFSRYPKNSRYVIYSSHPENFVNPKPEVITATATNDDPATVLKTLEDEGYSEVAICGGSSIYTMFMKAGLIDKIYLTVEPIIFGKGVPLFSEEIAMKLQLKETKKLSDQTLLLEYDVSK